MRFIEKSKKFLTLILVAAIAFITVTTSTRAVTDVIEVGDAEDLPAYIGGVQFAIKYSTSGRYLYCLEMAKKTPMNTTATFTGERDAGIANIILNGFPNKSFTGDVKKDYYITQAAIWWYLDETTGSTNLGEMFKETGSDEYNMRGYVKNLVDNALIARERGYATTNVAVRVDSDQLEKDGDYYTSKEITVETNAETYTVSLEGAPEGTKVVGTSGTENTTLNKGENFYVKVPVSAVENSNLNIKVTVTANGVIYKALEYTPGNGDMQKVTPGDIEPSDDKVSTSINLGLTLTPDVPKEKSKVIVTKYDTLTEQPLPGATLVIKDSEGKVIDTWTSTSEGHIVTGLAKGTYTVEETEAPEGYVLSNEKVNFEVTSETDQEVTVKFYNTPKEDTVVNITKFDAETGNSLAGAEMIIKDASGNEVERFTTTEEAHVITGLPYGTYTLSEVSAPNGYALSDEVIEFTLDKDHITYQIKFANYKEIQVPDTSTNSLLFTILGIAIIGSGLGFVYKYGKQSTK